MYKMAQEQKQLISKDMTIAEVLSAFPDKSMDISETMKEFGISCVGCGAASFETLEQGVLGHGFSEQDLNKLVTGLNELTSGEVNNESTKEIKSSMESDIKPANVSFSLTTPAVNKVKQLIKEQKEQGNNVNTLRVSVLSGGCSGLTYNLELLESVPSTDIRKGQDEVTFSIAKDSVEHLNGVTLDFVDTLNESGFKFNNPNEEASCGCGKSFH
jgi:iron-sulfur cluster assembly protein